MIRRATAAFLLAYLAWVGIGSALANEHVHAGRDALVVHRHSPNHGHEHSHEDHSSHDPSDDHIRSSGSDRSDHSVGQPPHVADSLLKYFMSDATHSRGNQTPSAIFSVALREDLIAHLLRSAARRSLPIRGSPYFAPPRITLRLQHPRPPPLSV